MHCGATSMKVHGRGVEPLCLSAAEPKSAAYANFATRARGEERRPYFRISTISGPTIHPDGSRCLVALTAIKTPTPRRITAPTTIQ
jgi:hypothetical protein